MAAIIVYRSTEKWVKFGHVVFERFEHTNKLDGKYSERVQIPAKVFLLPTLGNTCHTYYFVARYFRISRRSYF